MTPYVMIDGKGNPTMPHQSVGSNPPAAEGLAKTTMFVLGNFFHGAVWPVFAPTMIRDEQDLTKYNISKMDIWSVRLARISGVLASSAGLMLGIGAVIKNTLAIKAILPMFAISIGAISTPVLNVIFITLIAAAVLLIVAMSLNAASHVKHAKKAQQQQEALIEDRHNINVRNELLQQFNNEIQFGQYYKAIEVSGSTVHAKLQKTRVLLSTEEFKAISDKFKLAIDEDKRLSDQDKTDLKSEIDNMQISNENSNTFLRNKYSVQKIQKLHSEKWISTEDLNILIQIISKNTPRR